MDTIGKEYPSVQTTTNGLRRFASTVRRLTLPDCVLVTWGCWCVAELHKLPIGSYTAVLTGWLYTQQGTYIGLLCLHQQGFRGATQYFQDK